MALLRPTLPDRHPQRVFPAERGVREIQPTGRVHSLQEALVQRIAADVPETDEIERRGSGELEARGLLDPGFEFLRELDVPPDVTLEPFDAVVTDHEPELQSPEAAAKRDLPIAVVEDRAGFRGLVAQVLGKDRESPDQGGPVGD